MARSTTFSGPTVADLVDSFARHLRAENKSPKTITGYLQSVNQFAAFLHDKGMPEAVDALRREHVEAFIEHLVERWKPATASNRYRALKVFFGWVVDEGEAQTSPMERMKPPAVPEEPVPILTMDDVAKLIKACQGNAFEDRRDEAIIRLFIDSGLRRTELATIGLEDVDFDLNVVHVMGKGRRPRGVPFGRRTARALDRYLRMRGRHKLADHPALWLSAHGHSGGMTDSGVAQVVERRALMAGLGHIHPHQLRHTWAHEWLDAGGGESDLQMLAGWRSPQMIRRYGASAAVERARNAHQRLNLGDRV